MSQEPEPLNSLKNQKRKRAIFVVSQKGGVGKTTFARGLLDTLRKNGHTVAAYDADGQVGQLLQYHGSRTDNRLDIEQDPRIGVGYFDVRDDKQRDELVNALGLEAEIILMDMPGGSVQEMAKVLGSNKRDNPLASRALIRAYADNGYEVIIVVVISNVISSVRTVNETITLFGDEATYLVVKNEMFGDADDFVVFDGYEDALKKKRHGKGLESLLSVGGKVIVMPKMHAATYGIVDLESTPFSKINLIDHIPMADKMRVSGWLNNFAHAIAETPVAP